MGEIPKLNLENKLNRQRAGDVNRESSDSPLLHAFGDLGKDIEAWKNGTPLSNNESTSSSHNNNDEAIDYLQLAKSIKKVIEVTREGPEKDSLKNIFYHYYVLAEGNQNQNEFT